MGLLTVGSFEIVRSQQDADFFGQCKLYFNHILNYDYKCVI